MEHTEPRAVVRAAVFMAMEPFQSTETTRFYLNGVCIEPHSRGAVLVATDGHKLAAVLDEGAYATGAAGIWTVPSAALKPLVTRAPKRKTPRDMDATLWCDLQKDRVRVVDAASPQQVLAGKGTEIGCLSDRFLIDGTFPEWTRVVPMEQSWKALNDVPNSFQARYVQQCAAFGAALRAAYGHAPSAAKDLSFPLTIRQTEEDGPARVFIDRVPQAVIVLMPVRAFTPIAEADWLIERINPPKELPKAA